MKSRSIGAAATAVGVADGAAGAAAFEATALLAPAAVVAAMFVAAAGAACATVIDPALEAGAFADVEVRDVEGAGEGTLFGAAFTESLGRDA